MKNSLFCLYIFLEVSQIYRFGPPLQSKKIVVQLWYNRIWVFIWGKFNRVMSRILILKKAQLKFVSN